MMGAQRLELSAGLAVPKSEVQTGVADGLGWAGGDLGLFRDAPTDEEGRRLEEARPKALSSLYSKLTTLSIAMGIATFAQIFIHFYWKHRANKRYYARKVLTGTVKRIQFDNPKDEESEKIAFNKFPIVFVFPSIFLVVFKLFCTGLMKNSLELLVTDTCNPACKTLAGFVMASCFSMVALGWVVLTDFNIHYRKAQWKPAGKPKSVLKIDDPFYRGISMLRGRIFGMEDPRSILNRSQGKFGKPPAHMKGTTSPRAPFLCSSLSSPLLSSLIMSCALLSSLVMSCAFAFSRGRMIIRLTAPIRAYAHGAEHRTSSLSVEEEWRRPPRSISVCIRPTWWRDI